MPTMRKGENDLKSDFPIIFKWFQVIFMKGKNDLKSDVDFLSSYVAEVVYEGTAHFPEVKIW